MRIIPRSASSHFICSFRRFCKFCKISQISWICLRLHFDTCTLYSSNFGFSNTQIATQATKERDIGFWSWQTTHVRPCGLMDKAPDFGSGDCRFESCHGRNIFLCFAEILIGLCSQEKRIMNYYILECIWFKTFLWKKNTWKDFSGFWTGVLVRFGTNLKLWIIWRRIFDT